MNHTGPLNPANYYTHSRTYLHLYLTPTRPRPHNIRKREVRDKMKWNKAKEKKLAQAESKQWAEPASLITVLFFPLFELWLCVCVRDCGISIVNRRERRRETCQGWWDLFYEGRCKKLGSLLKCKMQAMIFTVFVYAIDIYVSALMIVATTCPRWRSFWFMT